MRALVDDAKFVGTVLAWCSFVGVCLLVILAPLIVFLRISLCG